MEWSTILALMCLIFCSMSNIKIDKVEKKKRNKEVKLMMSRLIKELVGKKCKILLEEGDELYCTIVDYDDDWLRIRYCDKKDKVFNKLVRVDNICDVEYEEE